MSVPFKIVVKLKYSFLTLLSMLLFAFNYSYGQTTLSGSGQYTVPPGVFCIDVQMWGAGGAGGSSCTTNDGGGGGGGGGYSFYTIAVSPGDIIDYAVGAGGTGVPCTTNDGETGNNGEVSTFGTYSIDGGSGGGGPIAGNGGIGGAGGVGNYFTGGNGGDGRNNGDGDAGGGGSSPGDSVAAESTWCKGCGRGGLHCGRRNDCIRPE